MIFTVYKADTGRIVSRLDMDYDDATQNIAEDELLALGDFSAEEFWINGESEAEALPSISVPTVENFGYKLAFADPPEGLIARVYDAETDPPHLLYDGPLSAPDCALTFVDTSAFRVELEAPFPYQPRALSFSTPIAGALDA